MRKNKGITLIALIITVIIILILVAVSVNILIKGDIIGAAEQATGKYKTATEEEANGGKLTIGETEYESIDDYLNRDTHNWQYTDNTRGKIRCTCARCKAFEDGDNTGRTLKVGQQIGSTENRTASTNITAEKSGYSTDQTLNLNAEETKWVVFGFEDKNNDGKNEILLLTTEQPTTNVVNLGSYIGYTYGIDEINRMCKELYGENARGITIEDINKVLGYTPQATTKLKDLGDIWTGIIDGNETFYDPSNPERYK